MTKVIAELIDLEKTIGNKTIVKNMSFQINEGEVLGLLGPNGAGKSTTIKMMVGLLSISKGDVLIQGHSVQKEFEQAMQYVGGIIENPEMYKFLTGYDNLIHYARMFGDIPTERIDEVVKLVKMDHAIHQKVKTYSLGMKQRLGVAQALLHRPKLLILDEPTNGLDPAGIKELRHYIQELAHKEGVAVLVSSHMLGEMELMCDRIAIIQNGELLSIEQVGEITKEGEAHTKFVVEEKDIAIEALKTHFPTVTYQVDEKGLLVHVERAIIPDMIRVFVEWNVTIYEVTTTAATLEDKFLEVTGGDQHV